MAQLFDTAPPGMQIAGYARVSPERGIDAAPSGLTYGVPEALSELSPGDRVVVPLGKRNRRVSGYVVELLDACDLDTGSVKAILSRDARGLAMTDDLMALARWMANYYCCPLGMVFAAMMPAAVKRGTGSFTHTLVFVPPEETEAEEETPPNRPKLTKLQRAVLEAARAGAGETGLDMHDLADRAGARSIAPIKALIDKGLLATRECSDVRAKMDWPAASRDTASLVLNTRQDTILKNLAEQLAGGFSVHLLHGVTGSGKTEVYLRIIECLLDGAGGGDDAAGAIVLVPEIALTPQTVSRFVTRFDDVSVLHSGLTDAQRHDQWRRIRDGRAQIVVGARSAVFAPLRRLGILIVDEEHESSYKQDQLPRYHARDVAIKRAQLANVPILLGSATPSLESYYNATHTKRYELHTLPQRVADLKMPAVQIVDLREERKKRYAWTGKDGVHLLSLRLETALRQTIKEGGQVILLLNRRGYANYLACPNHRCGWIMPCEYCDTTVVYHKDKTLSTGGFVRCHHCLAEQMLPAQCPQCREHKVTVFGLGTQRVEEELVRKFPGVRLQRMDADTMRKGRDYDQSLEQFRQGQIDLLVGTQMIAKGLDFPNVRLVGVISADTALHLPDFRAAERTFQLVSQVAGRTGRGEEPGLVIVQSFSPSDPSIVLAAAHDYESFAKREIELRGEAGLPPVSRMARIVVRYQQLDRTQEQAQRLATALTNENRRLGLDIRVHEPVPCPIARIGGYYRQQVELIAPPPAPTAAARLQQLMTALRNAKLLHADNHTAVDVDPVAMM